MAEIASIALMSSLRASYTEYTLLSVFKPYIIGSQRPLKRILGAEMKNSLPSMYVKVSPSIPEILIRCNTAENISITCGSKNM